MRDDAHPEGCRCDQCSGSGIEWDLRREGTVRRVARYEYMLLDEEFLSEEDALKSLNELGAEGWRVVSGGIKERFVGIRGDGDWYAASKFILEKATEQ